MKSYPITREMLLETLREAMEDQDYALAMWEGGAAGFGRVDQWSDADVQFIVRDGSVEQAFADAEAALAGLSETETRYRLPEPTWHGHSQCFYRFKDASPFLMLDLVFMQENSEADRFMQFRTHGQSKVWFDKAGLVVEEPLDVAGMLEKMQAAAASARVRFELFWVLVEKEIRRGNAIEAFSYYHSFALQPLHQMLRIIYSPVRYTYSRYPHYDLPKETADRLANLFFVRDLDDLEAKFNQARAWFAELDAGLDWEQVRAKLEAA
jgi:hypothetical protein